MINSMGIIAMIWEKISNKGFSSPNIRKTSESGHTRVLGENSGWPINDRGVIRSYTPIKNTCNFAKEGRRELKNHLKLGHAHFWSHAPRPQNEKYLF